MEKKTECEIVQDLLFGYADNTLNAESKKLVDKHLNECNSCRARLEEIKNDVEGDKEEQQKEIDYLKKLQIKGRIKAILIAIFLVFVVIFSSFIVKFIKITSIMGKAPKTLETQNFYSESREMTGDGSVSVNKLYYKDGRYKKVWEIYSDKECKVKSIEYGEVGSDIIISFNEEEKIVQVIKGSYSKLMNEEKSIKWTRFSEKERKSIIDNLGKTFLMSIKKDTYEIGKEYYILEYKNESKPRHEYWIDKETGLILKEIESDANTEYFENTDIVKAVHDRNTSYKYDFNNVTDDDVKVPSYDGYIVEEKNYDFTGV
ncbi:MAG: zf-HC2 domain-containing protein [Clostridia bacterium]|nr:zf-HC2 domain-containing protein [Clostridia bacterium]